MKLVTVYKSFTQGKMLVEDGCVEKGYRNKIGKTID